ncbi:MAG: helicase-related protein, partial [Bacillota bacterium]|nr:helicase-related protein [Bacillota bacterium]
TANEYLARRDKELMGQIHEFLGLKVGLNISQMEPLEKKEAYLADITYGTGTEFGFDFLRDNMVRAKEDKVQRDLYYAIVDEIDSILIDEARTPLIIANKSSEGAELFQITATIMKDFEEDVDYELYAETKQVYLTDIGAAKIEDAFGIENLYDAEHQELLHSVTQSLRAQTIMKLDVDYIVKEGKIALIDKFTGRIMEGRSFSDGLHQAIEAKEGLEITEENETFATITIQNYFTMYAKLSGMTGSALPSKEEFFETYHLKVIEIPTNKSVQRNDYPDLVYSNYQSKVEKIVDEVKRMNNIGRPVLIGTTSIEQSEKLSSFLKKANIKHQILNAKTEEDEAEIISLAGQKGQVMLATNMAGRGTDIVLGEGVKELGGLHIIGTERHESNRIDMQLRGRSGRQGDPGSTQFIVSLEDDLFIYYDEDEKERYASKIKLNESGLIISPDPEKYTKTVQETVENIHYSGRKHLLKLESVIDRQSKVIYSMRDRVLEISQDEMIDEVLTYIQNFTQQVFDMYFPEEYDQRNPKGLIENLSLIFFAFPLDLKDLEELDREEVEKRVKNEYSKLESMILTLKDDQGLGQQLKGFMLHQIDSNWISHLENMTQIKEGIGLRGYGQEDPYRHFEFEGLEEFKSLLFSIQSGISIRFMEFVKNEFVFGENNEEVVE